jgi:hypothetical protein
LTEPGSQASGDLRESLIESTILESECDCHRLSYFGTRHNNTRLPWKLVGTSRVKRTYGNLENGRTAITNTRRCLCHVSCLDLEASGQAYSCWGPRKAKTSDHGLLPLLLESSFVVSLLVHSGGIIARAGTRGTKQLRNFGFGDGVFSGLVCLERSVHLLQRLAPMRPNLDLISSPA